jgi:hypothetical protein
MNIHVHRYPRPTVEERAAAGPDVSFPADRWQGWIEDDAQSWIAFIGIDGRPVFWLERDEDGGVLSPAEAAQHKLFLDHLRCRCDHAFGNHDQSKDSEGYVVAPCLIDGCDCTMFCKHPAVEEALIVPV